MYVGRRKLGRAGLAGKNRLSGLRGRQGLVLGQDDGSSSDINWGNILSTGIVTAGNVAAVAVRPPTYSSVINPVTGAQTITSYGATAPSIFGTSLDSTTLTGLLTSPLVLLGGLALVAVLALKR